MHMVIAALLAAVGSVAALGQSPPGRLEFEVASIRPSAPYNGSVRLGVHIDGAQVRVTYLSLKEYLASAYRIKDYQISGPDWLASSRFDIAAKIPSGTPREQVLDMLQSLLVDRFALKTHREKKEFPVYGLMVGKGGVKMKESPPDAEGEATDAAKDAVNVTATGSRAGTTVNFGKGAYLTIANNRFEARKIPMPGFADMLARFVDRPVVDMTELEGKYDFTLEFAPEDFQAMMIRGAVAAGVTLPPEALRMIQNASGDSLFTAMQTLGLKLERAKAPLDVLVVDHMERMPTEN
jgi:uncharacterized protein (TIGR03435 family)